MSQARSTQSRTAMVEGLMQHNCDFVDTCTDIWCLRCAQPIQAAYNVIVDHFLTSWVCWVVAGSEEIRRGNLGSRFDIDIDFAACSIGECGTRLDPTANVGEAGLDERPGS